MKQGIPHAVCHYAYANSGRLLRSASALNMTFLCVVAFAANASTNEADMVLGDLQNMRQSSAASISAPWRMFGQFTGVVQWHPQFVAPYTGPNSLSSGNRSEETTDVTLYLGARVWQGGEVWINPEIDQGFGLDNTLGLAGFSSGEAYKVGKDHPYLRMPRLFLRQVISLEGEDQTVDAEANQMGGVRAPDNVILTVGKFSVVDVFDTNTYAHDPRSDFLNWAVVDAGAFDYAADAWGYTIGASAEWTQSWWTVRGGMFALSKVPNGKSPDTDFHQRALIGEWESRQQWHAHPGKLKLLAFVNHGRMASYEDAIRAGQTAGSVPDVAVVRHDSSRSGIVINLEQELTATLGIFARASGNDGSKEAFEFTEINKSVSGGVSIRGDWWGRHGDACGLAAVINGLSSGARQYLAAGGMGILIGDGQLPHYGSEQIVETYYSRQVTKGFTLSGDYQYIVNPAYNRDRGPVSIFGLRVHAEF